MPRQFTRLTGEISNVSDLIRLKRLGKIRLGIKKKHVQSGREYPSATEQDGTPIDYFVVPDEIKPMVGDKPKVLNAMFVSNDPEEVYQEKLAMYGQSAGLKCHGDGTTAMRRNDQGQWEPQACPCPFLKTDENPKGQCGPQANLMVVLPNVSMWGYYQIMTHSIYARAGILASLKQLQETVGRIAFIPLKLSRQAQDIVHDGKKKTHYIVGFVPDLSLGQIIDMRTKPELMIIPTTHQLEPPIDVNPASDPVDVEVERDEEEEENQGKSQEYEAAELADMNDRQLQEVQNKLRANAPATTKPVETAKKETTKPFEMIPLERWGAIIKTMENDQEMCNLLQVWQHDNKVSNYRNMNAAGQESLFAYMRKILKSAFPF